MQNPTGFNPSFDRNKESLIQLSNKNGGLDPLDYLYSKSASFQSLIASDIKGGLIDSYMIYTKGLDADIITARYAKITTIDAITINVTTLNSDYIHNKYKIDTHDLDVYDDITVGSLSSPATAFFHTSILEVASAAISMDTAYYSTVAAIYTMENATYCSIVSPVVTFNSAAFEINYIAGLLPVGTVGIYSGGLIDINAPILKIGDPTKLGITTQTISMKPTVSFFLGSASVDIEAEFVNISGQSIAEGFDLELFTITASNFYIRTPYELGLDIFSIKSAAEFINVSFSSITLFSLASETLKITSGITNITGETFTLDSTGVINLKAVGDVTIGGAIANITGVTDVSIEAGGVITLSCPATIVPVPIPLLGEGAIVPVEGSGYANFIIPNVLVCIDGVIKTVDYDVNIVFA